MNGWKLTAIISIILLVLSWGLFISATMIGADVLEREDKCSSEICRDANYDSYYYDSLTKLCYCYLDGEVKMTQKME